ncbi:MAG: T9SS type A sorting domain-containing protein [Bacteroidetes bacterium]|nr:T9SS type A sorting domain-containing protein [Bacteroidota bacterium]
MKKIILSLISIAVIPAIFMSFKPDEKDRPLTDQYIVIAWNDLGMHCANLEFANMCILPPYNNQTVHVIKKGDSTHLPVAMPGSSGIYVTYEIPGNSHSVGKTNFWDYSLHLFGVVLPPDVGLAGFAMTGTMAKSDALNYQYATGIPITAYTDGSTTIQYPYQLTMIKAFLPGGTLIASTQSVIPVSHEINCVSLGCHVSEMAILNQHEQVPGFNIANKPILCANCHSDPALGTTGQPGVPPFSQVIHMKHGEFIKTGAISDCYKCHPGPNTQCWRDVMHTSTGAITKCQDCHGSVYNVGKSIEQNGRQPWLQEPSCGAANCHGVQFAEEPGKLFKNSKGHGGLFCSTCHNSPHAILPTTQANDNVQNIALQGFAGTLSECSVCHGYTPSGLGPHGIPAIKVLQGINVSSGQSACYNATQNITAAGNGAYFNVLSGGNATLIAGRQISFLPGTSVSNGGHLWGYITAKGRYCGSLFPPMAPVTLSEEENVSPALSADPGFKIYPNPNTGEFIIEKVSGDLPGNLEVKVINLFGKEMVARRIHANSHITVNIGDHPDGIYLVRITGGGLDHSEKIIKQH